MGIFLDKNNDSYFEKLYKMFSDFIDFRKKQKYARTIYVYLKFSMYDIMTKFNMLKSNLTKIFKFLGTNEKRYDDQL